MSYEIRVIDNKKGKGMFATKPIDTGDVIVDEKPTMVFTADELASDPRERLILDHYSKLSTQTRKLYDDLSFTTRSPDLTDFMRQKESKFRHNKETSKIVSIFNTNGMGDSRTKFNYVAFEASRINHSCVPNAAFCLSKEDSAIVTALQSIQKGKEIMVAYVLVVFPKTYRADRLSKLYKFVCNCAACTSEPPFSTATSEKLVNDFEQIVEYRSRLEQNVKISKKRVAHVIRSCDFFVEQTKSIPSLTANRLYILGIYLGLLVKTDQGPSTEAKIAFNEARSLYSLLGLGEDPSKASYSHGLKKHLA